MGDLDRLGWHIPDNLRWLSEQDHRPDRLPCGHLTGQFLKLCADRMEGNQDEIARLRGEVSALRIGWWNDMRQRGVNQDNALSTIKAALQHKEPQP